MKTPHRNRLLAALALGALLATGFSASAEPARKDGDRQEARKDKREHRQDQRQDRREDRQERRQDRREVKQERREDRQDRRDDRQQVRQVRARIATQQANQRAYQQRIRAQQARQAAQRRAYSRHYSYAPAYRYNYGGRWYNTSHYGANMLRNAVQRGYQEGLRAGRSDRFGRYDFRRSSIWISGSYGYGGNYVSRSDYAHYFRQGFQRGYEDGFYGRGRYGHRINGEAVIIQAVLEAILGFQRLG